MFSSPSAQRLRAPGYAILASVIVFQFLEIFVRAWPFRIHAPAWRLGLIAATTGQSGLVLIAMLVALVIAASTEDRIATLVISSISWVVAVLLLVAGLLFALDVLQFRGQVPGSLADQYGVGSAWVGARLAVTIALLIWLAISSMRAAKSSTRAAAPLIGGGPIVGTPPRAQRLQQ